MRSSSDEFPDVAAESDSALAAFQERQVASGSRSLIELLEENIFTLATELPRKIMDPGQSRASRMGKVLIVPVDRGVNPGGLGVATPIFWTGRWWGAVDGS